MDKTDKIIQALRSNTFLCWRMYLGGWRDVMCSVTASHVDCWCSYVRLSTAYTIVKIKTGAAQSSNPATIKEG